MRRRYALLLAVAIALGLAIPLLYGGREVFVLLRAVSPLKLAVMLTFVLGGWIANAGRLRLWAGGAGAALGRRQALAVVVATEFAVCATPAGGGGPLAFAWLLARRGLPRACGLALYAADQFADMLFFLCALVVVALYELLMPQAPRLGWQLGAMAVLLLVAMGHVWLLMDHYRGVLKVAEYLLRNLGLSVRMRRRLGRRLIKFTRSLVLASRYSRPRLTAIFILCSVHWLLRYSLLYLAIAGVGGHVSWGYAFLVQMVSLTAGQLALLPGGGGGTEATSSLLLAPYLDPATLAAAILLWRFVTFYWYLIAGAPVFALAVARPWSQRRSAPTALDTV